MIFLRGSAWPQPPFPCLLSSSDFSFRAVNASTWRRQSLAVGVRVGTPSCTSPSNECRLGGGVASGPWLRGSKRGFSSVVGGPALPSGTRATQAAKGWGSSKRFAVADMCHVLKEVPALEAVTSSNILSVKLLGKRNVSGSKTTSAVEGHGTTPRLGILFSGGRCFISFQELLTKKRVPLPQHSRGEFRFKETGSVWGWCRGRRRLNQPTHEKTNPLSVTQGKGWGGCDASRAGKGERS